VIGDSQLEASIEGIGEKGDGMLKLPEVLGVAEARGEIAHVLEEVEKGRTFIIKGTKGREALVINADVFRRLQDAYLELVGELETTKILSDERAMRALQESSGERSRRLYSLSEVEGMIAEVEDVEGEQP
jgi:PHD/YefM family antitoxin component YafN of YafNO toxin-antitoxin module